MNTSKNKVYSDEHILNELMKLQEISSVTIQRKYKLSYHKAKELKKIWLDKQPKEPTFIELFEEYQRKQNLLRKQGV